MREHTPTPWISETVPGGDGSVQVPKIYATTPGDHAICQLFDKYGEAFLDAEANAAFIVKAVNSHDALVKALTELVIAYQDADSPDIQDTLRRARAAINGAVGGSREP